MKHTIKLLTLAFMLAAILTLTGCPGPVTPDMPCTHENKKTVIETAATCTEPGLEKIICADCEEVLEEQKLLIDPENHNWVLESDTATCTTDGTKKRVCSRCGHEEIETIPAHHTFIAGGCDKCGAYEHNKEDDYQIMAYVYSSKDDAKKGENETVLYFSFPASTEISKISLNSLIHMKSNYTKKTVSYNIIAASAFEEDETNLYSMKDLDLDNSGPMYIVVE